MLRKRIIFGLLFDHGVLYRTRNFTPNNIYTHNFIDTWNVDEIVLLDITRQNSDKDTIVKFEEIVAKFSRDCFVPLAVGGDVRSVDDFYKYLNMGADKIIVGSEAVKRPEIIKEASERFGAQCVVISVDVKKENDGYRVYYESASKKSDYMMEEFIEMVTELGAGEVFINSIDRDGMLTGYDLELVALAEKISKIPVIVAGGAGSWQHLLDVFKLDVSGACTTNIFHFTDQSILSAKEFLQGFDIKIRNT